MQVGEPAIQVEVVVVEKVRWHESPVVQRFAVWLLFGVAVALIPIVVQMVKNIDRARPLGVTQILAGGELLIVSAVLAASAIGELVLVNVPNQRRLTRILAEFFCLICIFVALVWYADLNAEIQGGESVAAAPSSSSEQGAEGRRPEQSTIARGSAMVFLATVVAGSTCVVTAERSR